MSYCIKDGYVIRPENDYSSEEGITDRHQNEGYLKALSLVRQYGYESVLDIGCGRAFKLLKYFRNLRTLGLDLPPTVRWLNETYPDRQWVWHPLTGSALDGHDLIIAADVIEHLLDPDTLLDFVVRCRPKMVVLSTPDRDLLSQDGPPGNTCHVREWTFMEFALYVSEHLRVLEHFHSRREPENQIIVARPA